MDIRDLIDIKKSGQSLTFKQINLLIKNLSNISESQLSALLMAILFKGMSSSETYYLTSAMRNSGDIVDTSFAKYPVADKHSTGGVSDTVTLVAVPVLASAGVNMVKMSGRGLSHTGGTIDKLESIPGFKTSLTSEEIKSVVLSCGAVICGQTAKLAPADKYLYSLRDFISAVDSIPLIASSIMSKKLASGSDIILLDVKYGNGAFMKTADDAVELAKVMVDIAHLDGKKCAALITSMQQPLTGYIGCNLELQSAINVLNGEKNMLYSVSKSVCAAILVLADKISNTEDAEKLFDEIIQSGKALDKFRQIIKAQGGDDRVIEDFNLIKTSPLTTEGYADKEGYISLINAENVGKAVLYAGGGRESLDSDIDHGAGVRIYVEVGTRVSKGQKIYTVYSSSKDKLTKAKNFLDKDCIQISDTKPITDNLIYAYIDKDSITIY